MYNPWTKAIELEQWAARSEARLKLPGLLRRLIWATTTGKRAFSFPAVCRSIYARWKLDNGSWQWTTEEALTFLSSTGTHTLTASALDEDLQLDQTPAVAKFEITIDPNKQMVSFSLR